MKTIIGADAAKLAGLQIDTLQKVRSRQITLGQWERFNNLSLKEREARFGDIKNLKLASPAEPIRSWHEKDGVIYFSLSRCLFGGEGWISYFGVEGVRMSDNTKSILYSDGFKLTHNEPIEIAVLKDTLFATDDDLTVKNIRAEAYKGTFTQGRKLFDPNADVACLIRQEFGDNEIKAMGVWWIVTMHEPIEDSDGNLSLLNANRGCDRVGHCLGQYDGRPDFSYSRDSGFAFAVSPQ